MNTLKTVVVTVVLMAVGYGMYVSIWKKPEQTATDKTSGETAAPTVQIPGPVSTPPSSSVTSWNDVNSVPPPGSLPPQAPLFGPNSSSGNTAAFAPLQAKAGSLDNRVTLIPGPNATNAPTAPPIPPVNLPTAANPPSSALLGANANPPGAAPKAAAGQDDFLDKYRSFLMQVEKTLDEGRLPEALQALTSFYEIPNLPEPQRREVEQLLDQLAGTVIYSRQHHLEKPYTVQQGDTLDQIADRCNVPALVLARINGLDPKQLQPGQELKVLRGPFTAVVSLDKHELTLKLEGGYYAGRFPIGVGSDCPKLEGSYTVREKTPRPIYRGPGGAGISPDDGRNPLGKYWIGLSDRIGLHGTIDEAGIGRDDNRGTICLKDRDIDDLFGILSVGSQVVIRR